MNEPENNLPIAPRSEDGDEKCESLRRQINLLFGALIVTSFTLTAYLGLEARRSSMDYLIVKPRTEDAIKMVQQDDATMQSVFGKLEEFGRTHPDFQAKILSKYKINTNTPAGASKK
jgi:hypothetical protein